MTMAKKTRPARKASRKPRRRKRAVAAEATKQSVAIDYGKLEHVDPDDMPDGEADEARLLEAMRKVPPKPRWDAPKGAMSAWLKAMLKGERVIHELVEAPLPDSVRMQDGKKTRVYEERIIAAAEELDYRPLATELEAGASRRLQRYVAHKLLTGGFAARKPASKRALLRAADDVAHILRIWRTHYGRRNRAKNLANAEDIAAQWHGVSVASLCGFLKKRREANAAARRGQRRQQSKR